MHVAIVGFYSSVRAGKICPGRFGQYCTAIFQILIHKFSIFWQIFDFIFDKDCSDDWECAQNNSTSGYCINGKCKGNSCYWTFELSFNWILINQYLIDKNNFW